MKVKNNFVLLCICVIYLMIFPSNIIAQESFIKDRCNIKLAYSRIESNIGGVVKEQEIKSNLGFEIDYGLLKTLETNMYYRVTISDFNVFHYGLGLNYQILPHFVEADDFRVDFYIAGKIGRFKLNFFNSWSDWEYGIGPGVRFFIFNQLGVFFEYSYGEFFYNDNSNCRLGLSYKLKKRT